MMTTITKRTVMMLAAVTVLGACNGQGVNAIQQRVQLQSFSACSELESYIKDTAVEQMRQELDEQLSWRVESPVMASADAGMASAAPEQSKGSDGPAAHTETNVQVQEVDEPDFVKNDGTRIVVLSGGKLYTARSWPPEALALAGKLDLEGSPQEMFLDGERVVVFSTVSLRDNGSYGACFGWNCTYGGDGTKITVIDVSDLAAPRVVSESVLPGYYRSARRVGSAVRLVLVDSFRHPEGMRWYPEHDSWDSGSLLDQSRLTAAYDTLKRENERLIRAQPLEKWIPSGRAVVGGRTVSVGYSCSDFYRSNAPTKLGLVSVISLNLDRLEAQPARTAVVGADGEIYASKSALYLASRHWWWWGSRNTEDHTYLHKFDISDPDRATYVASGGIEGHLLDQFAMDEHQGFFRVAVTVSRPTNDLLDRPWQRETVNRVLVLRENAGDLEVIGRTADLAEGERIFSARFQGDRGYVVTFRQVDPLFTLDLSDPRAPRVVGELKIPGFSTYIHPLDRDHLLTIGTYTPDPAEGPVSWSERRMKLSVFDVSDFAAPREQWSHLIGTANGWSDAAYEHKAFNYFPERGLLAIPFSDYDSSAQGSHYWSSFISELRVFKIDLQQGIRSLGALSFRDIYQTRDYYGWSYTYSPWIRRSVMATDTAGQDFVYAISDAGIRVAPLQDLASPLQTVLFDPPAY